MPFSSGDSPKVQHVDYARLLAKPLVLHAAKNIISLVAHCMIVRVYTSLSLYIYIYIHTCIYIYIYIYTSPWSPGGTRLPAELTRADWIHGCCELKRVLKALAYRTPSKHLNHGNPTYTLQVSLIRQEISPTSSALHALGTPGYLLQPFILPGSLARDIRVLILHQYVWLSRISGRHEAATRVCAFRTITVPWKGYAKRDSNRQITKQSLLSHF